MAITSNAVARRDVTTAIAIRSGQDVFDDRQVAALAVLGVKDATKADLAVYFHVCRQTGLDPFLKQIHLIGRREKQGDQWVIKQTIQVGIDGFRIIRDRAAKRDGVEVEYSRTIWYDNDGSEHKIWLRPEAPAGCEMTVYKNGRPFPAVLTFAEYVQTNREGKPTGKWRDAPAHQLEKCAEAFGLRRAFPHDLGNIRLEDEMPAAEDAPPAPQRVTAEDITRRRQPAPEPEPERPARGRSDRPTGAMLGKLGKLLGRVFPGGPDDDAASLAAAFLTWQAGRDDATTLEALTRDEALAATRVLEDALARAEDDTEQAASAIWAQHKADQQDAESEASDE